MQNAKNFVGKDLVIENGITMTVPDSAVNSDKFFLIGLNFNASDENGSIRNDQDAVRNKIPMLMLKIDTEKVISVHSSEGEVIAEKNQNIKSELKESILHQEKNPKEIYFNDSGTSERKLPHENLSFREIQVMKLIALGKARKEIANELYLSVSTINTYRARILEKMNMKNNAEIMRYAFQHKFVE